MGCGLDLFCYVSGNVQSVESDIANQFVNYMSHVAVSAEKWAIGSAMSLFLGINPPNLKGAPVQLLEQDTVWFAGFAGVLGLLITAIRLALERKASAGRFAMRGMLNIAFVFTCGVTVISLGEVAGEKYSAWIIDQALGSGNGQAQAQHLANITKLLTVAGAQGGNAAAVAGGISAPLLVTIFVATLGFCGATAQIFLLLMRNAMLGLLVALLPISAAASTTETGTAWFRKHITWLFAYLLYGPVAATIIAYAYINLMSSNGVDELSGGILFMLSVVALPALMRLVAPMVAQATVRGGSGGIAAATGVATGVAGVGVRAAAGPVGAVGAATGAALWRSVRGREQPNGRGHS